MKKVTSKILWITLIIIVLLNIVMVFYKVKDAKVEDVSRWEEALNTEETDTIVVEDTIVLE